MKDGLNQQKKICPLCEGKGEVPDFDCYHGRPDHSPVQCGDCRGTGTVTSPPQHHSKEEYLEMADRIIRGQINRG